MTAVTVDAETATAGTGFYNYRHPAKAAKLYRDAGWLIRCPAPSIVGVTYTHGWADDDQALVPAQAAVLGLARQVAANPSGVESESIDDYRVQYAAGLAEAAASAANLRSSLIRVYGSRAAGVAVLA